MLYIQSSSTNFTIKKAFCITIKLLKENYLIKLSQNENNYTVDDYTIAIKPFIFKDILKIINAEYCFFDYYNDIRSKNFTNEKEKAIFEFKLFNYMNKYELDIYFNIIPIYCEVN